MKHLSTTQLFLLDLDGTFYLDDTLLPGAADFLQLCRNRKIAFSFLTNNSSKSKSDYLTKLRRLGIEADLSAIYTSGDAMLRYLAEHSFGKELLLIGTQSLMTQFTDAGYTVNAANPCAVVLGFDTTLTYEKLVALCDAVRAGIPFLATHPDLNCPVANGGMIPDIGAVLAFVKASTGRVPDAVIGKPNAYIAQAAAENFGVAVSDVCMVGDRLYTDIALGQSGCATALVLCGETSAADYAAQSAIKADFVCENLAALGNLLREDLP
ncbi:MAG: HAD-IIA family hydrolase [Ruthenibacterium sp.]